MKMLLKLILQESSLKARKFMFQLTLDENSILIFLDAAAWRIDRANRGDYGISASNELGQFAG